MDASNPIPILLRGGPVAGEPDAALLDRFRAGEPGVAEAAFAVLVERHAAMVRRTCRRVTGDHHDAEDAAQAAFLLLARSARSIRAGDSLAGWLHGTARRLAARVVADAARRRRRERRSVELAPRSAEGLARVDPWAEVHEAVDRLPERYRLPILLCHFEGLSYAEAADRLACPVRTVQTRLARGRARMRGHLKRRGVDLAPGLAALARPADPALPAWAARVARAVVRSRAGDPSLLSPTTLALASGALRSMRLTRILIGSIAAATVALGGAGGMLALAQVAGKPSAPPVAGAVEPPPPAQAQALVPDPPPTITILLADAPPPIAGDSPAAGLARGLFRRPLVRPNGTFQFRLFLFDIAGGRTTLIVDEPGQGHAYCGSAQWSGDGSRIYFDATPLTRWSESRLMSVDPGEAPQLGHLGFGNSPSPSPDGRRLAYLSNRGQDGRGVYIRPLEPGGEARSVPLEVYGRPRWSPDGKHILVAGFGNPCELSVVDAETREVRPVRLPGRKFFGIPSWVDGSTIAVAVGAEEKARVIDLPNPEPAAPVGSEARAEAVARVDVSDPEHASIARIEWRRGEGGDFSPSDPVIDPKSGRCWFVGMRFRDGKPDGEAIFEGPQVVRGVARSEFKQVGFPTWEHEVGELALSPDGRFIVFQSDRHDTYRP